jgi:hypothetical protein
LAQENDVLKKVIEQMKSDMEKIVARVKQEYINDQDSAQSDRSHIVLQQAIIQKT